ncbi:hypothetical protein BDN72DRAFT_346217 [Pluteus cervinus]|uniref:Uncharacterized protein n=1 Tax=Pluteus cervinus TaxID=181527 RepID=A0ACD3AC09_9AGAR|nr:hypothetical protein BDN72DRAFT_346217 [Pluteus cervinus]
MDHQFRSDLRTIGDVDEEYQKTVEQISRLEDRLQELRTYRDHLAPISRLPVEALTEIFSLLHEQSLFDYQRRPCGHVLTATVSICRHWRQIVISTPSFWTHIGTISVPWLECSLERLKDSPLVIDLSLARSDQRHKDDSRSISKMLDILQRSLPTIRSFTFWASKNSTRRLNRFDLPGNASWGPAPWI